MVIFKRIITNFQYNSFIQFIRCYARDKHFTYFREKNEYKNSVIQLINKEAKIASTNDSLLKNNKHAQTDTFFSHFIQRENVMKLSTVQLKDIMYFMANTKFDCTKYENTLAFIDEKCALSVDRWPLDLCLYILDAWFIILGPKVFRKHYYYAFTNLLNKKMKKCSKYNLILALYFIGISKRSPPFLMELITYKMEHFASDFIDEEWAIACLSFFKTSTKVDSDLLLKYCCKAAENLMFKNDNFNLISILKCLRLSDYVNLNLMTMLQEYIKKECKTFNFVECTNFLASFTSQNIYNFETYSYLENQGISALSAEAIVDEFNEDIKRIHPSERSRVKDLARFLWGLAFVGHNINQKSTAFMVNLLNARLKAGEFESNLPALIDCVQSLILFGCYPLNIIEHVLSPISLQKISNIDKAKPKYQLYFINRSSYLESCLKEIKSIKFISNIPKNLEKDIAQRKSFQDLIEYLNANLKVKSFAYCYIMPHIMISGLFIATDHKEKKSDISVTSTLLKYIKNGIISKTIEPLLHEGKLYTCIELLDPSVCVYGSIMPLGLMKTKIHHLKKLNINVITMSPEDVYTFIKSGDSSCAKFLLL